jgi:hypothetical protein
MTPASFRLTSNCLPIAFQLPVFQLAVPIELEGWKNLPPRRPLYRLWRLYPVTPSRGGATHRRYTKPAPAPLDGIGPTP